MQKQTFFLLLVVSITTLTIVHSQNPKQNELPKIRNVDDPKKDPAQYSQQWMDILAKLESTVSGSWQFGSRWRAASTSNLNLNNISQTCASALSAYFEKPLEQKWSFQMWDSNGHLPSGILAGSFWEPGNYDQCMRVEESAVGGHGKYCLLEFRAPHPMRLVNFTGSRFGPLADDINFVTSWDRFSGLANGLCLPSVCSDQELEVAVLAVLPQTILDNFRIRLRLCQESKTAAGAEKEMRFGQKMAIAIVVVNVLLALLGTFVVAFTLPTTSKSLPLSIITSFSLWDNSRLLFKIVKSAKDPTAAHHRQFKFIHGLRVFSIYWVIYAHVFLFHPFLELADRVSPVQSLSHRPEMVKNIASHLIANGGLAVGTFFIISGALTIYTILPVYKKNPINFFSYVLLRWMRFAPPSLGMICFMLIWPLFGSGPLFVEEFTSLITEPCYNNWWPNFFFITNFYDSTEICNVMTWYLGADFQLHILLFVVIYFYRRQWFTRLYIGTMIVLGFLFPVAIVLLGTADAPNPSIFFHPTHHFPMDKVGFFIFGTYNHFIPYFAGVVLGLLFLRKKPLDISATTCWILWLTVFPLMLLLPFASLSFSASIEPVNEPLPSAIIFGIVRLIWSAGMFWLCYECACGRAGVIRRLLSADFLQPLSRLTFTIYLVHTIPIWHHYFSLRNPVVVSMQSFLFIGTANCVYATILAYFLYLLFEAPYVNLMKVLLMPLINGSSSRSRSSAVTEGKISSDVKNNKNSLSNLKVNFGKERHSKSNTALHLTSAGFSTGQSRV